MAAIETASHAPFGAITVLRVTTVIERGINALRAWHLRRRTVKELSALSRSQLADIGLEGMSFDEIARGIHR